jgi:hypothetical protein
MPAALAAIDPTMAPVSVSVTVVLGAAEPIKVGSSVSLSVEEAPVSLLSAMVKFELVTT